MAKQATIIVLLLVFVGAIFIHYILTAVEGFKNKKRRNLKRKSGKRSGKRRSGKRSPGRKLSGKRSPGRKLSGKKRSGKRRSGKRRSGKRRSGKSRSGKSRSGKRRSAMSSPKGYDDGMKFSDVVGSLLSPSLPDSRDLKDRLHAAVETTIDQTPTTYSGGRQSVSSCSTGQPQTTNTHYDPSCSKYDNKNLGCDSMPYIADMDDYIRKDNIPCYGCNLK